MNENEEIERFNDNNENEEITIERSIDAKLSGKQLYDLMIYIFGEENAFDVTANKMADDLAEIYSIEHGVPVDEVELVHIKSANKEELSNILYPLILKNCVGEINKTQAQIYINNIIDNLQNFEINYQNKNNVIDIENVIAKKLEDFIDYKSKILTFIETIDEDIKIYKQQLNHEFRRQIDMQEELNNQIKTTVGSAWNMTYDFSNASNKIATDMQKFKTTINDEIAEIKQEFITDIKNAIEDEKQAFIYDLKYLVRKELDR